MTALDWHALKARHLLDRLQKTQAQQGDSVCQKKRKTHFSSKMISQPDHESKIIKTVAQAFGNKKTIFSTDPLHTLVMQVCFILLLMLVLSQMIALIVLIACVTYEGSPGISESIFA
jgi:hypothetical protein